jgi:hypothetical protein
MIKWFKKLFKIVREYDADNERMNTVINDGLYDLNNRMVWTEREVKEAVATIIDRTELSVDVSPSYGGDPHQVIMVGRYKNRDFVQAYSIDHMEFDRLVQHLTELRKHAHYSRIDAVPDMKFIIEREGTY